MSTRFPSVAIAIGLLLLLAGCSTPSSRISDNKEVYASYPADVQNKIAAGQVDVGFTTEQAKIALGEPSRKFTRTTAKGSREVWAYTKSSPIFSFGIGGASFGGHSGLGGGVGVSTGGNEPEDKLRVVFEGGRVVSIEQTVQ